jgi:hypothetical protein
MVLKKSRRTTIAEYPPRMEQESKKKRADYRSNSNAGVSPSDIHYPTTSKEVFKQNVIIVLRNSLKLSAAIPL